MVAVRQTANALQKYTHKSMRKVWGSWRKVYTLYSTGLLHLGLPLCSEAPLLVFLFLRSVPHVYILPQSIDFCQLEHMYIVAENEDQQ